jgi:hypothetical protein
MAGAGFRYGCIGAPFRKAIAAYRATRQPPQSGQGEYRPR